MSACAVDIWTFDLDSPRPLVLSPEELARANRFRFEKDRRHWSHARSALRTVLADYVRCSPESLVFRYGPNGKPGLSAAAMEAAPDVEFNLSHSHRRAMLAVTHGISVGIDLEEIRESVDIAKLLQRIGETEVAGSTGELFHLWTRREARTKAVGGQLMEIPAADLRVRDLIAPEGFAASVALVAVDPEPRYREE